MSEQRELDIQGHKIVATSFNEGKGGIPAFFIHGITASINFWEPIQLPIFVEKFNWLSLSLPGHYPATLPKGFQVKTLTADMIAEVLSEAIRKLAGKRKVVLVGHSTGGFAALNIAARSPDMAAALISISGFVNGKWNGILGLLQKIARSGPLGPILFKTILRSVVANRFIYRMTAGLYAEDKKALYSYPDFETILDIAYRDAKMLDASSVFPFFNRLPDVDICKHLPLISAPTLAIAGARDPIVPAEQSRIIAQAVPDCELHILEGTGHLPMFERAAEYDAVITKWIKRIA